MDSDSLNSSGWAMVLPLYNGEVLRVGAVSCLGAACIDGLGFFQVLLVSFSKGPGCLPMYSTLCASSPH